MSIEQFIADVRARLMPFGVQVGFEVFAEEGDARVEVSAGMFWNGVNYRSSTYREQRSTILADRLWPHPAVKILMELQDHFGPASDCPDEPHVISETGR